MLTNQGYIQFWLMKQLTVSVEKTADPVLSVCYKECLARCKISRNAGYTWWKSKNHQMLSWIRSENFVWIHRRWFLLAEMSKTSVILGSRTGVAARLRETFPWLISNHCCSSVGLSSRTGLWQCQLYLGLKHNCLLIPNSSAILAFSVVYIC